MANQTYNEILKRFITLYPRLYAWPHPLYTSLATHFQVLISRDRIRDKRYTSVYLSTWHVRQIWPRAWRNLSNLRFACTHLLLPNLNNKANLQNFQNKDFKTLPLYKKWSFPLKPSSVIVTKAAGNCGFGHIYWRNPWWKTSFVVQCAKSTGICSHSLKKSFNE